MGMRSFYNNITLSNGNLDLYVSSPHLGRKIPRLNQMG